MFEHLLTKCRPYYAKHRTILTYGGAAFLLILTIYTTYRCFFVSPPPETPPKVVEVEIASKKAIQQTVRLIGRIHPKHSTILIAKAAGTLDSLLPAGQFVKKGKLIAKIDNADREKQYILSKSAEVIARVQYERLNQLSGAGHSSKRDVEDKKQAWIEAQKTLAVAKIDFDQTQFIAPFDGIIGVFKVLEGTQVEPGNQVVSFYDPSSLMVEFDIPASYIHLVQDGQSVQIGDKTYPLTHVQRMIDEETHMCPAYVDISCDDCVIGESTPLELAIQQKKDVIVLPFEAVFLKNDKPFVYLVKGGKTIQTPVTLGIREKDKIEIAAGLQVGDTVIIRGQERLSNDSAVTIEASQK